MPTFSFKGPDGRTYTVDGPEGSTREQAFQRAQEEFQKRNAGITGAARTLNQAWLLDPAEAVGQMAEHIPGVGGPIRRGVEATGLGNLLRQYRAEATANPWQETLRTTGNILNPLYALIPELRALGPAARIGTTGGVIAGLQPEEGEFSWLKKGWQIVPGMALAGGLGSLGERVATSQAAQKSQQAVKAMEENLGARTSRVNEAIKALNAARQKRFEEAKDQRAEQRYRQQVAAQTATAARQAVPRTTAQEWWREALTPIGEEGRAPTSIGPQSSGQVQRIIGDRLNAVHRQMSFTADPSFGTAIRDLTSQTLNAANRDSWEQIFNESVMQPILKTRGSMTGQDYADYVMDLGSRIEELSRRIRSEDMPESRRSDLTKMRNALRSTYNAIEDQAQGTPELKAELKNARRAYNLWSIGNNSTGAKWGGEMDPGDLAHEWESRQGQAAYSAEMTPGHPTYDAENARLKGWLETQRQAHLDRPAPPAPQPPLTRPGEWELKQPPTLTLPATPTAESKAGLLPAAARALTHGGLWHYGGPVSYFAGRPLIEWLMKSPGARRAAATGIGKAATAGSRIAGPIAGQLAGQSDDDTDPRAPAR